MLLLPPSELQNLIADPSSCAVITLLLRILFAPDLIMGGPELADRMARATLGATSSNNDHSQENSSSSVLDTVKASPAVANMFYAMAGKHPL